MMLIFLKFSLRGRLTLTQLVGVASLATMEVFRFSRIFWGLPSICIADIGGSRGRLWKLKKRFWEWKKLLRWRKIRLWIRLRRSMTKRMSWKSKDGGGFWLEGLGGGSDWDRGCRDRIGSREGWVRIWGIRRKRKKWWISGENERIYMRRKY